MATPMINFAFDDYFRAALEQSSEGVVVGLPNGTVWYANPAACRTFGCSLEEFRRVGRGGLMNVDDPVWPESLEERRRAGATTGIARALRADGTPLVVEYSSSTLIAPDGEQRTCTWVRDITERVRAGHRLEAYDEIAEALLAGTDAAEVLGLIARHAWTIFDAACAAISTPAAEGREVDVTAAHGPLPSDTFAMTLPAGGLGEEVMATGQAILTEDFSSASENPELQAMNVGSAMIVPIGSESEAIGALILTPREGARYTRDDVEQAATYAAKAGATLAFGLARAQAERQLRLNAERLQQALETRIVIEQAKGFLAGIHGIGPDEAFNRMRSYARSHNAIIHVIAAEVVARRLLV